uniref:Uncharacterized protein n=1 Tax=Meloidogyne enterolobii TaxID=390850 RepID=A0A6V7YDH1_MELEN|nr:unnamed protein product [Meloidogyne enterolobii]
MENLHFCQDRRWITRKTETTPTSLGEQRLILSVPSISIGSIIVFCYVAILETFLRNSNDFFSVFSNYIPKWKCLLNNASNFARNCTIYQQCPENLIQFEENIPFHSAAMEFGWICGSNAYNRALFR